MPKHPTFDQINVFGMTNAGDLCDNIDRWTTNKEGMTWGEWYFSTYTERELTPAERAEMLSAWRQGVDPSEYRSCLPHLVGLSVGKNRTS